MLYTFTPYKPGAYLLNVEPSNKIQNASSRTIENKMPVVSGLVKKTNYDSKIWDIDKKYLTTSDYNKFTKEILDGQCDISSLVKNSDFNTKLSTLANKSWFESRVRKNSETLSIWFKLYFW